MSHTPNIENAATKRCILLFGDSPMGRDKIIQDAIDSGLQVVLAKLSSDRSETISIHLQAGTQKEIGRSFHPTEVLPDDLNGLSEEILARLRRQYGEDWCTLPLNDYIAEYAASISVHNSCYPQRSAEIVKRKHELRNLWNELARENGSDLYPVEYCYLELRDNGAHAEYHSGGGFENLPENIPLVIKPDELSSSIEIHSADCKREALNVAHEICAQLRSKWYEVGRSIGTEVRPRVIVEKAIDRSPCLHRGSEYSVEFVSFQGQHTAAGIVQKWTGPNFIETGHLFPAESFPVQLKPVLVRAIETLLDQLGVRYGVSHWEFIVTSDERIALVEGHLRPAGDRIMELIKHSTSKSPTAALFEALASNSANFSFEPEICCGVYWMVPESPLSKVTGITVDHSAIDGFFHDLNIDDEGIRQAANWSHANDWLTRFAHVLVTGANLQEIQERSRRIAQSVSLFGVRSDIAASTRLMLAIDQPSATRSYKTAIAV